jgi:hypothetical protein
MTGIRYRSRPRLIAADIGESNLEMGRSLTNQKHPARWTVKRLEQLHARAREGLGLAQIEARAGAPEEVVKRLRRLLAIAAGGAASIAALKIDPVWDPIRNRPDFQQLLSGPEQIGPNE